MPSPSPGRICIRKEAAEKHGPGRSAGRRETREKCLLLAVNKPPSITNSHQCIVRGHVRHAFTRTENRMGEWGQSISTLNTRNKCNVQNNEFSREPIYIGREKKALCTQKRMKSIEAIVKQQKSPIVEGICKFIE
jgi:hypothetical protein